MPPQSKHEGPNAALEIWQDAARDPRSSEADLKKAHRCVGDHHWAQRQDEGAREHYMQSSLRGCVYSKLRLSAMDLEKGDAEGARKWIDEATTILMRQ